MSVLIHASAIRVAPLLFTHCSLQFSCDNSAIWLITGGGKVAVFLRGFDGIRLHALLHSVFSTCAAALAVYSTRMCRSTLEKWSKQL